MTNFIKIAIFSLSFLDFWKFQEFPMDYDKPKSFRRYIFFCLNFSYKDPTLWIMRLVLNNNEHGIDNNANWFLREEVLSK